MYFELNSYGKRKLSLVCPIILKCLRSDGKRCVRVKELIFRSYVMKEKENDSKCSSCLWCRGRNVLPLLRLSESVCNRSMRSTRVRWENQFSPLGFTRRQGHLIFQKCGCRSLWLLISLIASIGTLSDLLAFEILSKLLPQEQFGYRSVIYASRFS